MSFNDVIKSKLEETSKKVDGYIQSLLMTGEPKQLYDAARHLLDSGGKRIRPYILIKSCELVGGDPSHAIPFAAAVETLHNFTLIHDDIMDNDRLRRGSPTVHVKWGVPIAITSGDLLFAKTYESILKSRNNIMLIPNRFIDCIERITMATISICEGQAMDLSFPNFNVNEADYIRMIDGKTASLFKACAEIGGIVGGGEQAEIRVLGEFAWNAGITFQLMDDYLGLIGEEKTLGKPIGSDIREGKKTLIIIHALSQASPDERERIRQILGNPHASKKDVENFITLIKNLGSLEYVKNVAEKYANEAGSKLSYFAESEAKHDLSDIIRFFLDRVY